MSTRERARQVLREIMPEPVRGCSNIETRRGLHLESIGKFTASLRRMGVLVTALASRQGDLPDDVVTTIQMIQRELRESHAEQRRIFDELRELGVDGGAE